MRVSVAGGLQQRLAYQAQCLAIAKEVGDRVGEGRACGNLGTCHMHLNEYFKAVAYFEAHHALATSMKLAHGQSQATINMGVVFKLHLTHLTFDASQEDTSLAHLKEHLSWRVQRGRDPCAGCGQTRGEDTQMLTCSGCRVAQTC